MIKKLPLFIKLTVFSWLLVFSIAHGQGVITQRPIGTVPKAPWGYLEYLPVDYNDDPTKQFPMIIHLAGVGEKGNGNSQLNGVSNVGPLKLVKQGKWPVLNSEGNPPAENFIIISPQSPSGFFNRDKLLTLMNLVKAEHRVDPDRIYIIGLSAGAFSVWKFINAYPNEVAAVIPVAGKGTDVKNNACFFKDVPLWAFHGDNDKTVGVNGSIVPVNAMNACTPPPSPLARLTIYPGVGHNSWSRTYNLSGMGTESSAYDPFDMSIYDWLLQYSLGTASNVPIANAGNDINLFLPTNSTNLMGSGSVVGGTIVSYAWSKLSGPAVTLTNANQPTATASNLVEGTYTFELTVTDNNGLSDSDEVVVTVQQTNQAPTANAGSNATIVLPTNSLTLQGTGSDTDGTIASYAWTKVNGPAATLSGASTPDLSLSNLVEGTYTFRLTVTDNDGATGFDDVTVTVQPAIVNQDPTANAGADATIVLPTNTISLAGSGNDPDGTIASYLWEKISGPAASISNANNATATATGLVEGVYTFRLTVTDDAGGTDTDDKVVTVEAANQSPTANAGSNINIQLPTNVTNITGSGSDTDGSIASYQWSQASGPSTATLSNENTPVVTVSALIEGTYTFGLIVTDDDGATGYDDVMVIVSPQPVNQLPTANAGSDRNITLPTNTLTLNGGGSDTDGTVVDYQWIKKSGPTATLTNETSPSLSLSDLLAGTYVFELTVTDNDGGSDSDEATVTVQPAVVNQAPTANAGSDQSLTLPIDFTTLNGSGTDPDGTIASYSWAQTSGPAATLANENTASLSVSNMVAGTYVFTLTVTDDAGATDDDDVTVIVKNSNVNPTANAGDDQVITLPTSSITLNGSGSDIDGTIASYMWEQVSGPNIATLSNENTNALTASNLAAGDYVFNLTVTDNDGGQGTDQVNVMVNGASNIPPTANAGADQQVFLPTNTVVLAGSVNDADGSILSIGWQKVSGPNATLVNENTNTLTVMDLVEGTYVFRLTATDNQFATGFDEVQVEVFPEAANQTPTVNAGGNRSITLPTNTITLNGTASDIDGSISTYTWTRSSGPAATLTNQNTPNLTLTNLIEGTYVFRLTVQDDDGATAFDEATLNVLPEVVNQVPTANAGGNRSIILPTNSITLFGSGSDSDGSVDTYSWSKDSGPTATLSGESTPTLALSNLLEGTYTFRLTVTDDDGATDFDIMTLTVLPAAANQSPVANAGADKSVQLPTNSTTLNGSGSDPDGSISTYSWIKLNGPAVTLGNANTPTLQLTGLVEGTYRFRLTVTDDEGATDSDEARVTVLPQAVNQSPSVNVGNDRSVFLPEKTVTIVGTTSDPDGTVVTLSWTQISGPGASLSGIDTKVLTVDDLVEGTYIFRLTATDDDGAIGTDDVQVTVFPEAANQPPVAFAGNDEEVFLPNNTLTLDGFGRDDDGTVASFLWTKLNGPSVTLTNEDTEDLSLSDLVEGVYNFRLEVTDDDGATSSDDVKVTVFSEATNLPPVVDAGADIFLELPDDVVSMRGSASDPNGTIANISWERISGPNDIDISDPSDLTTSVTAPSIGTYVLRLTVTDDGGLSSSDDVNITVDPELVLIPPVVDAGQDVALQLPDNQLRLEGIADDEDGVIETYIWEKLVGPDVIIGKRDSTVLNIVDMERGRYLFRLTAVDNDGLSSADDVTVIVRGDGDSDFPKFFSPNGDGINDFWEIVDPELVSNCQLVIYDKIGRKVFEANPYNNDWDGTINGRVLEPGAYYYVFTCEDGSAINGGIRLLK
ncbi:MAG: PKD domain-containing protein [Bacteroidota bacterium]